MTTGWQPMETAPLGVYVLLYGARLPWIDHQSDPKFVVAKRRSASEDRWEVFGPGSHSTKDFHGWQPLPAPPLL